MNYQESKKNAELKLSKTLKLKYQQCWRSRPGNDGLDHQPIRGQYPGHVISFSQSAARSPQVPGARPQLRYPGRWLDIGLPGTEAASSSPSSL